MTRLASLVVALVTCTGLAACEKPTEDNCRKAIANMRRLMGTDNLRDTEGNEGEVRRCKGGSKRKAVECAIKATSLDELRGCGVFKVPASAPGIGGEPTGSAGSAGSATGSSANSGAVGSADAGSATGSGSAAMGSTATGSAATGSAATGSAAAGSGTGAAAAGSGPGSAPAGSSGK